jgi:hypothetical protein
MLASLAMPGLVVLAGEPLSTPLLGLQPDEVFLQRVRQTLDPRGVFA